MKRVTQQLCSQLSINFYMDSIKFAESKTVCIPNTDAQRCLCLYAVYRCWLQTWKIHLESNSVFRWDGNHIGEMCERDNSTESNYETFIQ